jgi:hypothetical protein
MHTGYTRFNIQLSSDCYIPDYIMAPWGRTSHKEPSAAPAALTTLFLITVMMPD